MKISNNTFNYFTIGALIAVMIFAGYVPTPKSTKDFKGSGTVVILGC